MLAGIVPAGRIDAPLAHLDDPAEFNRPHRVPSLGATHPAYEPGGGYWKGGVWPPTNYMILRGLTETVFRCTPKEELRTLAACVHLQAGRTLRFPPPMPSP